MKTVFVTVGTTKFPKLVDTITTLDVIKTLKNLGYDNVQIQTGKDFHKPNIDPLLKNVTVNLQEQSWAVKLLDFDVTINYNTYFDNFEEQIRKADLVISHAGAGSCLDVLRLKKPLIVVTNEDLMDNHQTELAEQLQKDKHLFFCNCNTLVDTLHKDFINLVPHPQPDKNLFSNYLDKCCGFVQ
ncbi:unnamed protein product [Ceutorhynchus assimilis]|uniref:UDP-N-acetylglucosamine transferase subunit ALG13 n=1 Tax=Ceutorhynchus assimilis TaxID=467358 RepID=A0A9N9MQU0_9CUCU|nr:unnamed protein product [Ceutorhynchus assimilis]